MDADQYVPIVTVAQLEQISQLTSNLDLIVELLKGEFGIPFWTRKF